MDIASLEFKQGSIDSEAASDVCSMSATVTNINEEFRVNLDDRQWGA